MQMQSVWHASNVSTYRRLMPVNALQLNNLVLFLSFSLSLLLPSSTHTHSSLSCPLSSFSFSRARMHVELNYFINLLFRKIILLLLPAILLLSGTKKKKKRLVSKCDLHNLLNTNAGKFILMSREIGKYFA